MTATPTPRSFPPGDRWAYFKLYCGETTADRLLPTHVGPLAEQLERDGLVTHWFFVRYVDSAPHLRVRFHLADTARWDAVLDHVNQQLAGPVRDGLIWKVQVDTYDREIDRYGPETIETAERLFHRDSQTAVCAVGIVHDTEDEDFRWQAALLSLERYADDFGYGATDWLRLIEMHAQSLLGEMDKPKDVARQLDRRFREKRAAVEAMPAGPAVDPRFGALAEALDARSRATHDDRRRLAGLHRDNALHVPLDALVASYLHMSCNRLFPTRQRHHELVVYWFHLKMLRSRLARRRQTAAATI